MFFEACIAAPKINGDPHRLSGFQAIPIGRINL